MMNKTAAVYVMSPHGNIQDEIKKQGEKGWKHSHNYIVMNEIAKKFRVLYVVSTDDTRHVWMDNYLPENCRLFNYGKSSVRDIARATDDIRFVWLECGPSLPYIWRLPKRVHVHLNYDNQWWNTSTNSIKRALIKQVERILLNRVDSVSIATGEIRNTWPKLLSKAIYYHKGIDTNLFTRTGPGGKQIAWVGRFDECKNPMRMIKIWKSVHDMFPDWRLAMVGEGPLVSECMEAAKGLHIAITKESLIGVCSVLNNSSIYVLTSDFDASPKTVIEAQSMAMPVITTNLPGIASINEFAYKCNSEDGLIDTICYTIDNLSAYKKDALKHAQWMHENCDLRRNTSAILNGLMHKYNLDVV